MEKRLGAYIGTDNLTWWKPCWKYIMRGAGEYWYDEGGFYFRRYFTKEPIFIPADSVQEIRTGKWHHGRWLLGRELLKIVWNADGEAVSSGFDITSDKKELYSIKSRLEELFLKKRERS